VTGSENRQRGPRSGLICIRWREPAARDLTASAIEII